MAKRALVIGVTGQDGAYLSRFLISRGYEVVGTSRDLAKADLYRLRYLGLEGRISLSSLDVLDRVAIRNCIERYQPGEIYNLAAQSSVGLSFQKPDETLSYNTNSVLNVLESIREVDSSIRFYQASSSEMFGNVIPEALPIRESHVFNPASPYAISKAAAHWIAVNYREAYDMFVSCGILFNHESVLRGSLYVTRKILSGAFEILEGGRNPLVLGNLEVIRDWGYAPDYVEAMWLMLQPDAPADYIVCSGNRCSLRDYVNTLFSKLGLDAERHVQSDPSLYRAVDLMEMYGDNSRTRFELGWSYDLAIDGLIDRLIEDEREFRSWKETVTASRPA